MGCANNKADGPKDVTRGNDIASTTPTEQGPVAEGTEVARVANAATSVIAAAAARAALEAIRRGVPFADVLIGAIEKVHEVYEGYEDIQREVENLSRRLEFLTAEERYGRLDDADKRYLDIGLQQATNAVEQSYAKRFEHVLRQEKVVQDLQRADRFLTNAVKDITLYMRAAPTPQHAEEMRQDSQFLLPSGSILFERYLTESRCKVYLGSLRLSSGSIAVAIKLRRPKGEQTVQELLADMLKKECRLQHQARHRSVLKLLGVCVQHPHEVCQGCALILTPFIKLGSMGQVVAKHSDTEIDTDADISELFRDAQYQLTVAPACCEAVPRLLLDIAAGLKHIHDVEPPIVHLDIKPQNILLDYHGSPGRNMRLIPKIADFDLSREAPPDYSMTTNIQGSIGYMAPEQYEPKFGKRGPHSDVFAFGMLIFFAITRTNPSPLSAYMRPDLRREGSGKPAYDKVLCCIAEECWRERPNDRPTMDHVWRQLTHHTETQAVSKKEALSAVGITEVDAQLRWSLAVPPSELAAVVCLASCQRRALSHIRSLAKVKHELALAMLQDRFQALGFAKAALWQTLGYFREWVPVIIHVNLTKMMPHMEHDTHYRNQFQTGTSGGLLKQALRETWERNMFGAAYDDATGFERCKYGVLNDMNDYRGVCQMAQYGDSYLVLKDVRLRCTNTTEKLFAPLTTERLSVPVYYGHVLQGYGDAELLETVRVATSLDAGMFGDSTKIFARQHKETHIHGEICFAEHVERLVAHQRHRCELDAARLQAICEKHGWKFSWMDEERGRMELEEMPKRKTWQEQATLHKSGWACR